MRQQTLEVFVIGLLGTISAFAGQNPQSPPVPKASIEGIVTSAGNGQPLRKARVLLQRKDRTNLYTGWTNLPPAITDDSGHFSIEGLDEGQYRGSIEREGFVTQKYGQKTALESGKIITVAAGENLKVDFQMMRAGVISGHVSGEDGRPVSRATVQAYAESTEERHALLPIAGSTTDDRGEYRLFGLQPGRYFLGIMMPLGSVHGVNESGSSAGFVDLLQPAGHPYPQIYFPGRLAPEGAEPINLAAAEMSGIDFRLQPFKTVAVRGRVTIPFLLAPPRPVTLGVSAASTEFVRVNLIRVEGPRLGLPQERGSAVNRDGSFEIQGVFLPGPYTLIATARANAGPFYATSTRIEIRDRDIEGVTLALRSGVDVEGKVVFDSPPPQSLNMTDLRVRLMTTDEVAIGGSTVVSTDDGVLGMRPVSGLTVNVAGDGSFVFKNVVSLEYNVKIEGLPRTASLTSGQIGPTSVIVPFVVEGGRPLAMQLHIGFSNGAQK